MKLLNALKAKYPDGSLGRECAAWAERLASFGPVGDSLAQKQRYVQLNGIIAANIPEVGKGFRIGDVVVTNQTDHGHVFLVADMDESYLYAAESNFDLDQKIHYGRKVAKLDPKIYGVIRAPLKFDLGVCNLNYDVFFNNQPPWHLGILDEVKANLTRISGGKLNVTFYPLKTNCKNWWYEDFIFDNIDYKVIAKAYLDSQVMPLSFTNHNFPADVVAFFVSPREWQGSVSTGQTEFAFTSFSKPGLIQGQCAEFDLSPYYFGMRLVNHLLIHELAHYLYFLNGLNDDTHIFDNPTAKDLDHVFSNINWDRVIANL